MMNIVSTQITSTGQPLPENLFVVARDNIGYLRGTRQQLSRSGYLTAVIFIFIGVFFIGAVGFNDYYTMLQLPSRGRNAQATITRRWYSSGKSTTYYVAFTFQADAKVGNNGTVSAQQTVGSGTYNRIAVGQTVPVRYLPDNPAQVRLSGAFQDDSNVWGFIVMFVLFAAFGAIMLVSAFREMDRNARLMHDGSLIIGQLTSYQGYKGNKGHYYIAVSVGFQTPDGQLLTKSVNQARSDLKNSPRVPLGTPVAVLYVDEKLYKIL